MLIWLLACLPMRIQMHKYAYTRLIRSFIPRFPGLATETNAKDDKEGVEAALELAAALVHVTNDNPMRAAILKNLQNGVTPGGF